MVFSQLCKYVRITPQFPNGVVRGLPQAKVEKKAKDTTGNARLTREYTPIFESQPVYKELSVLPPILAGKTNYKRIITEYLFTVGETIETEIKDAWNKRLVFRLQPKEMISLWKSSFTFREETVALLQARGSEVEQLNLDCLPIDASFLNVIAEYCPSINELSMRNCTITAGVVDVVNAIVRLGRSKTLDVECDASYPFGTEMSLHSVITELAAAMGRGLNLPISESHPVYKKLSILPPKLPDKTDYKSIIVQYLLPVEEIVQLELKDAWSNRAVSNLKIGEEISQWRSKFVFPVETKVLLTMRGSEVKSLILDRIPIGKAIMNFIVIFCQNIEMLSLRNCTITAEAADIFEAIKTLGKLKVLRLDYNKLYQIKNKPLLSLLTPLKQLQTVTFSQPPASTPDRVEALMNPRTEKEIHADMLTVTSSFCRIAARELSHLPQSIRHLSLRNWTNIGGDRASEVATMIYGRFPQLQTLDIRGCHGLQTTVARIPALRDYFPMNHRGRRHVLHSHTEEEAVRKRLESLKI